MDKKEDLKLLNFVCKYLHAFTLADIATVKDKNISHHQWGVLKASVYVRMLNGTSFHQFFPQSFFVYGKALLKSASSLNNLQFLKTKLFNMLPR